MIDSKDGNQLLIPSDLFDKIVLTEDMKVKLDWHFFLKPYLKSKEPDITSALTRISDAKIKFK